MRNGKISLENISGGELTSSPLLSSPSRFSRLLQNFYINSEGHITKIPGYSPASNQIPNILITSGIDFKKSDGTSIKLVGGRTQSFSASKTLTSNGISSRLATFTGSGVNDLTTNTVFTGSGTATFNVEVAQGYASPLYDIWRWRKNAGAWNYFGGTSPLPPTIALSDGVTISIATPSNHTTGDKWVIVCHNPHLDDAAISGTFTGGSNATFEVEIDVEGTPDTFRWRKDSGSWTSGVTITGSAQLLSDGISITFLATTGHSYSHKWTITASPTTTTGAIYRLNGSDLSLIKSDFASTDTIFMAQVGDVVVASNKTDRPVAYNGSTFQNLNLPFGNSTVFTGVGLNDLTASISFTYETATYEVEIDAVAISNPAVSYSGTGGHNDMTVYSVDYSGAAATANFQVAIDGNGAGDTIKYNVNGGLYVTGQALTTLAAGLDIGSVRIKASATIGHNSDDVYEFQVTSNGTPDHFKWRKNGGAWSAEIDCPAYPAYQALDADYSISFDSATGNTVGDVYAFQVDGATAPDTFQWRKDSESWVTGVPITAGGIILKEGVSVKFKYFTGHTVGGSGNAWNFDVARDTVKWSKNGSVLSSGQVITGESQEIRAGVTFQFGSINGHTLGDKWTMPVDQSVRFGKLYPYKNRLWAIGSDGLTAYYSALLKPTDFTGEGSGYIDFRYVIPQGDELVDIGSMMNFIVFFFKNHIVIYAGTDPTAEGDFVIYQNIDGTGVVAPNTVLNVGSDIYFLTNKGVKSLKQLVSAGSLNVDPMSESIDHDIIAAIEVNTSGVYSASHYAFLGLLLFQIGNTVFVFNYRQKAWSRIVIPSSNDVSKILSMFVSDDGYLYMGGYDYLFLFDPDVATYNFNGQAPSYRWTTGALKVTSADAMYFNEMRLRLASTKAATMALKTRAVGFDTQAEDQADFNQQDIAIPAITVLDAILNFVRVPLFGAGKFVQFDFTHAPVYTSNEDLEFVGLDVQGELGMI